MSDCEERLRELERQLFEARNSLKMIGDVLINYEAHIALGLSHEAGEIQDHPGVSSTGYASAGLSAAQGRLAGLALSLSKMTQMAYTAAGPDTGSSTPVTLN